MSELDQERKDELENVIENIMQDAHNKAIRDCHHLILGCFDDADNTTKPIYMGLEHEIVRLYKQ